MGKMVHFHRTCLLQTGATLRARLCWIRSIIHFLCYPRIWDQASSVSLHQETFEHASRGTRDAVSTPNSAGIQCQNRQIHGFDAVDPIPSGDRGRISRINDILLSYTTSVAQVQRRCYHDGSNYQTGDSFLCHRI